MSVTRSLASIPVSLVLAVVAAPVPTSARPMPAADGYTTYVACSTKATAKPARECRLSQTKAAFFLSTRHDATYKVCVKFPGRKKRLCASAQVADKGEKTFVTIATASTGKHKVRWYVAGQMVGSWTFDVV